MSELSVQETFKQRITDNLRANFMNMLPEEMLSGLIDQAMEEFVNGVNEKRFTYKSEYQAGKYVQVPSPNPSYCAYNDPDTLKGMIWVEIVKKAREQLSIVFANPEWQAQWDTAGGMSEQVIQVVEEIMTKNPEVFVAALFRNIITSAMSATISNIRNSNMNMNMPYMGG